MTLKLVLKGLRQEKLRFLVAILGVAAATGLIVWSLGLAITTRAQSRVKAQRMSEPFDCWVSTTGVGKPFGRGMPPPPGFRWTGRGSSLPPTLVEAFNSDTSLSAVQAFSTIGATLDYRPGGRVMQGPPMSASLTLAPVTGSPYQARLIGSWPDPASAEPQVAVCTSIFTPRRLALPELGSTLVFVTPEGTVNARITGFIEMPHVIRGFPTAFCSIGALEKVTGGHFATAPTLLLCRRKPGTSVAHLNTLAQSFNTPDAETAAEASPSAEVPAVTLEAPPALIISFVGRRDVESQFSSDSLNNFKRQAPLLLTLAVMTTLCMLVNALTVGIEQHLRVLALLRAVGMTARQMLRMVALEGMLIAASGWFLGLLGGWALLSTFVRQAADTFPEGTFIGWEVPLFSALGVGAVAAASLVWPCRRAAKIRPMDVAANQGALKNRSQATVKTRFVRAWLGCTMLFPMLILALPLPVNALVRSILLLVVGIPLHIGGLLLCMPAFIRVSERLLAPLGARLLGLHPALLRQRITRNTARTVGMVLTLTVGLASFIAIHVWGASLTKPFIPSTTFPDAIVSILPNGVANEDLQRLAGLKGVAAQGCLAIEALQLNIADTLIEQTTRVTGRAPASPNVLVWGVEPTTAFGGAHPLAEFVYSADSSRNAATELLQDDSCIITKMLARETGLRVGDTLELKPRGSETGLQALRVVAIADLNWHLVTSRANMRGREGMPVMTMGPVFVSEKLARNLSGNQTNTYFVWLNYDAAYRAGDVLQSSQALEADIRRVLAIDEANTVRVHNRDEISDGTIAHGNQLVGAMARAPFWSLIVLATGMITLLVASFQASAQEFATMRAIGMTRGQLGRLLLGEVLLTGIVALALSIASGVAIGWTFTGWTRAWMSFGGLPITLDIPWLIIARGMLFALALCLAMAALPIIWLVRKRT